MIIVTKYYDLIGWEEVPISHRCKTIVDTYKLHSLEHEAKLGCIHGHK